VEIILRSGYQEALRLRKQLNKFRLHLRILVIDPILKHLAADRIVPFRFRNSEKHQGR